MDDIDLIPFIACTLSDIGEGIFRARECGVRCGIPTFVDFEISHKDDPDKLSRFRVPFGGITLDTEQKILATMNK